MSTCKKPQLSTNRNFRSGGNPRRPRPLRGVSPSLGLLVGSGGLGPGDRLSVVTVGVKLLSWKRVQCEFACNMNTENK